MSKQENSKIIKVWDIPTRLFHWVLVIAFAVSAYSAFQDKYGDFAAIHQWSGFTILALVSWRILWGVFGSETSRFAHFVKSPKMALEYAKSFFSKNRSQTVGHNPLGAYSVLLMIILLLVQASMGLFASDGMFFDGPLSSYAAGYTSDITDLHETLGYILFGVIGLHLCVIFFYWFRKKTNLLLPMLTGSRPFDTGKNQPQIRSPLLALAFFSATSALLYYLIF